MCDDPLTQASRQSFLRNKLLNFQDLFRYPAPTKPRRIEVFTIFYGTSQYFEVRETSVLGYPLKLLLNLVESRHGPEGVAQTLAEAGLPISRVYRLNEPYDESEAQRLSAAAFRRVSLEDIAEEFFKDTLVRFPTWFEMCKTSREFLEMQPEIHNTFAVGLQRPEERKAVRDKFRLEKLDDELVVHYRSPNLMCEMYKAIAQRVFRHYRDD